MAKEAIKVLSPRTRDIISRRFGIRQNRQTLESIGRKYNITRERVRQIEEDGLRALSKPGVISIFAPAANFLKKYIDAHGCVIDERKLFADAFKSKYDANVSILVLSLYNQFKRYKETPKFHAVWTSDAAAWQKSQKLIEGLSANLQAQASPVSFRAISEYFQNQDKSTSTKVINSYLSIAKNIKQNKFGHWGLAYWPEITPKGIKDKAYLVLKRKGAPQHFRGISELINQANFSPKSVHVQTVHNELIKDGRFVLVGRGTYALTEWGFKPGTVRDVIIDVMKSAVSPLEKKDIIKKVLKEREVKENTILINLQNSKYFKKTGNSYTLV